MNLSWIAGFYEGEGCPSYCGNKRGPRYLNIQIVQAGTEGHRLLKDIQKFLGFGNVYVRKGGTSSKLQPWVYVAYNRDAHRFAKMILPFMHHKRKLEQLKTAMKDFSVSYPRAKTYRARTHERS